MKFLPQLKLMMHSRLLSYLKGGSVVPINIEISPCGICNANCPWCFYDNNRTGDILDTEVLMKFIDEAVSMGVKAITWTGGGEPTLHPDFKYIAENITIDQGLITNGLVMPKYDAKVFSWIRVSKTEAPWNEDVLTELKKSSKSLGMCINWMGENEDEIKEALEIAHRLDIDYVQVRPALPSDGKTVDCKMPSFTDEKLLVTKYKFDEARLQREYDRCEGYHFVPFLWEDGNLDVCGYQRDKEGYGLGNIYEQTLFEIMCKKPSHVEVLSDCQICCKNHEINKLLYSLKEMEDINFV